MAFVDQSSDPTQQNQQQNNLAPGASNQAPQTSTGVSSGSTPGSGGAQGAAATPTQSKVAPVQNLQDYLTANAPQVNQQAQAIAQGLGNQYSQVQGDINNASSNFNNQVQQGTVGLDQGLLGQATASPSQFVQDPNNVAKFGAMRDASYKGPTDFTQGDFYGNLNAEVQNAVGTAANAFTPQGLGPIVNSIEKNPTPGETTLDSMLLQGNPDALQTVQTAAQPLNTLGDYLNKAATTGNAAASNAVSTNNATAQAVQQALSGSHTSLQDQINKALSSSLPTFQQNQSNYAGYQQNLTSAQNLANILSQLGTHNPAHADFTNVGSVLPHNIISAPSVPSIDNVASQDQYSTSAALDMLANGSMAPVLNQANKGQAGTFAPIAYDTLPVTQQAEKAINDLNTAYPGLAGMNMTNTLGSQNTADPTLDSLYAQLLALAGTPTASTTDSTGPTLGGGTSGTTPPAGTSGGGKAAR